MFATMFITKLFLVIAFMAIASMAEKQTYVIHMDKTKIQTSNIHSSTSIKQQYEMLFNLLLDFEEDDEQHSKNPSELLYVYESAISGFAAKLSEKQIESLKNVDGFLSATPDEKFSLHTTHTPTFLGLEVGKGLWNPTNLASDVVIGLVDTGIWPEHVSFEDKGMSDVPSRWKGSCENGTMFSPENCNKKLVGARAFFKGYESGNGRINEADDFRSPRDKNGHGTHTASTAAGSQVLDANLFGLGNGSAVGMTYSSRIAVYKACWESGCVGSDLLAAIDQAVIDGVDVLSLSLGGFPRPYYSDLIAVASFGATRNGVFVSCSAGNSGPSSSSISNPAPWITTVAASYTDRNFPTTVHLGDGKTFIGSSLYVGKPTKVLPIVYNTTAGKDIGTPFCLPGTLNKKLVKRKLVVCLRGGSISRSGKGQEVKSAGGAGMILLNILNQGEEQFADPHVLPATSLGLSASNSVRKYIASTRKPTASIIFNGTFYGNTAPVVAAFSSRGPSLVGPDVIKPDLTAPGVNILAGWTPVTSPTELKTDNRSVLFNIISGTSMSCPHVSGLAALLKSVHKDWSPAAIKSALMTTSYTINNKNTPILDISSTGEANPFAFGSGHVNPEAASDPGLIYDITTNDYLNYLCSLNYTASQINLFSGQNFTCPDDTNFLTGNLNYPSFAVNFEFTAQNVTVTYTRTVTNVGIPKSSYVVQVDEPEGVKVKVEPKKLAFKKFGEKVSYKVTFVGLNKESSSTNSTFGDLKWVFGKYVVRSPIAVTWE